MLPNAKAQLVIHTRSDTALASGSCGDLTPRVELQATKKECERSELPKTACQLQRSLRDARRGPRTTATSATKRDPANDYCQKRRE